MHSKRLESQMAFPDNIFIGHDISRVLELIV